MNITKHRPTNRFRSFPVSFNDMFENFFNGDADLQLSGEAFFRPSVDVIENEKGFEVDVAVPGIKKDEIKLDISNNELMISGERKSKREESNEKYHLGEIRYGKFSRTFRLPENVDKEKIEAKFEDGILKVYIPKSAEAQPLSIQIK